MAENEESVDQPTTYTAAVGSVHGSERERAENSEQTEPDEETDSAERTGHTGSLDPDSPEDAEPASSSEADSSAERTSLSGSLTPDSPEDAEPASSSERTSHTGSLDPDSPEPASSTDLTERGDSTERAGSSEQAEPAESSEPDDATDPAAPARRRRRAPKLLIAGRVAVALVSLAVITAMSFVYLRVDQLDSSKNTTNALSEAQEGPAAVAQDDGANDILIVGNDSRTDMQGKPLSKALLRELRTEATDTLNTDTLILLRIPHNGGKGSAVSIPRDTSVLVPNLGREEKINGAFGLTKALTMEQLVGAGETDRAKIERDSDDAGRTSLIQAVQVLTGVRVDHYTEVSLYGFYLLTEVIDGVDVCLNRSTSDPDSGASFAKGPQTVRGGDAVSFVRQRKNLPRGDLDRIVRQQTFLSSAMNKVLSSDLLTNNAKLAALQDAVSKTVVMDDGLHFLELVNQAQALASGNVQFVTIPVVAVGARNDRGQSIVTVDLPAVHAYVAGLVATAPPVQPAGLGADYTLTSPAAATQPPPVPCVD